MKKQAAMIAICAALLMCVAAAGCTSSTSSSPNASATANSSSQAATAPATASAATPTASAATPTATPTGSASGLPAGYKIYYFYEEGCPYCEAFSQTSDYAKLAAQPGFTPVVSTNAPAVAQQLGVTVSGYPTAVLVNSNGAVVGTWEYPNISAATIFAQA